VALAAMLSPTTLSFSVLALVLGDAAASEDSTPKTWVAMVDVVAGLLARAAAPPLAALVMLVVARERTVRALAGAR
jgi:hypothetical protein